VTFNVSLRPITPYSPNGGAPKVHEELHGQRKWMKEWRQVGRHLQAMEGERGDRIS